MPEVTGPGTTGGTQAIVTETQTLPIDDLAFIFAIMQTKNLDDQLKTAMKNIQSKQSDLAYARKMLELAQQAKADKNQSGPQGELATFLTKNGVTWSWSSGLKDDELNNKWDTIITSINNIIQNKNSGIELDMLSLQSLMNKRNQALEMASTIMKKAADSKESLIRNL
ncbi:MAG: hypothetical protein WHS38_09470 [Thermodesulforhabdaceae bacterium]